MTPVGTVVAANVAVHAVAPPGAGAYVIRGVDGRVAARLTLRSGAHAETKFVIELAPSESSGDGGAIGGNLNAGGQHAVFVDRMLDCRLVFALGERTIVVTQSGRCGFPPGTSAAGRYRRTAT